MVHTGCSDKAGQLPHRPRHRKTAISGLAAGTATLLMCPGATMKNVSPYASLSRGSLNLALAICLYLLVVATAPAANGPLTAALHAAVAETYKATEPGAAIIVVKDGEVVLREGAGMANLEMGIAVEPQMVFRIGSVTKQFTAVSILLLSEQGKLSLADDITRFLPDYPTHGVKITIENLLTHTSGIKKIGRAHV